MEFVNIPFRELHREDGPACFVSDTEKNWTLGYNEPNYASSLSSPMDYGFFTNWYLHGRRLNDLEAVEFYNLSPEEKLIWQLANL